MSKQGMKWYKREPQAFLDGTLGLDPWQYAVYGTYIDLMYLQGGAARRHDKMLSVRLETHVWRIAKATNQLIEMGKLLADEKGNLTNPKVQSVHGQATGWTTDVDSMSGNDPEKTQQKQQGQNTDKNRIEEIREKADAFSMATHQFDTIWKHYPRRVKRKVALDAWRKAIKIENPQVIMAALGQFVRANANVADKSKIPHLSTWLNQERWQDDQGDAVNEQQALSYQQQFNDAAQRGDDLQITADDILRIGRDH